MPAMLWRGPYGLDRCSLDPTPTGWRLAGTALLAVDDAPHEIRYSLVLDSGWNTLTVGAHVQGPDGDRRMALTGDGSGAWSVTDQPVIELFGAMDVDLTWTPATNTIPIRRLDLDIGEKGIVSVARISFPEHDIAKVTQHYERLDEDTYRYRSGDFEAALTVNEHGLVTTYGDLWSVVASA